MNLSAGQKVAVFGSTITSIATIAASAIGGVFLLADNGAEKSPASRPRTPLAGQTCLRLDERVTAYFKHNPEVSQAIAAGKMRMPPLETTDEVMACGDLRPFVNGLVKQIAARATASLRPSARR
jgi:hypothetical protein